MVFVCVWLSTRTHTHHQNLSTCAAALLSSPSFCSRTHALLDAGVGWALHRVTSPRDDTMAPPADWTADAADAAAAAAARAGAVAVSAAAPARSARASVMEVTPRRTAVDAALAADAASTTGAGRAGLSAGGSLGTPISRAATAAVNNK